MGNAAKFQFPHSSPQPPAPADPSASTAGNQGVQYTKAEVNYRPAGSSNTRCFTCSFYTPSQGGHGICSQVAGDIAESDVCDLWQGKSNQSLADLIKSPTKPGGTGTMGGGGMMGGAMQGPGMGPQMGPRQGP